MNYFYIFLLFIALSFGKIYIKYVSLISIYSQMSRFILSNILGFKVDYKSVDKMSSKIVFVTSHTSFYDGIISVLLLYGYLYNKYQVNILVKKDFAKFFKFFNNRYLNTISIDRKKRTNIVDTIYNELNNRNNYIVALAPEGTRSYTENVKTGFWHIAKKLDIPIVFVGIDFKYKFITFTDERNITNIEEDIEWFKNECNLYTPLYPDRCAFYKNIN